MAWSVDSLKELVVWKLEGGRAGRAFLDEGLRGIAERGSAIAVDTAIQPKNFEKSYES